jgi:Ca2+-binding RTX toxin-like protein
VAAFYGDAGDDYLATGDASTTAFIYGGDGKDYIAHNGLGRAEIDGGAGDDVIYGSLAADLIHGGAGNDFIDGRGGVDQLFGDANDDTIHWDYADLFLGTVDGGTGYDKLDITGQKGVDDFLVSSLGGNVFKVANSKAGAVAGAITGTSFEDLRLDARAGADKITLDYMGGSGLNFIVLGAGKNVVNTGGTTVTSNDLVADSITVLGHDGNGDQISLNDNIVKGVAGTGLGFAGAGNAAYDSGLLTIVVADSVRSEGDTLTVSTRGGNDSIDASAVATDRAALTIIAGNGDDTLKGTRFNDVIDSGRGSDTVTGDFGLDEFFDSSPSATNGADDDGDGRIDEADENEIDTLVENLATRTET